MLFQISSMSSKKSMSPYNAFLHQYHQQSKTKGSGFAPEATKAYNNMKESFAGDKEGWKGKCSELVQSYDLEKAELVSNAAQFNEGHAGIMGMSLDKMAKEVCQVHSV
jgi:hypothetical protein